MWVNASCASGLGEEKPVVFCSKCPDFMFCNVGFWCGIELDKPHGKNDGSVGGVQYFSCLPRYGIFAPPSRVQR